MTSGETSDEMHRFFDDVEELLRRSSDLGDEEIARLRARVETSILQVKATATDGVESAVRNARTAARDADDYVRGNPWMAIGVAAVAGLLIGSLLNRK